MKRTGIIILLSVLIWFYQPASIMTVYAEDDLTSDNCVYTAELDENLLDNPADEDSSSDENEDYKQLQENVLIDAENEAENDAENDSDINITDSFQSPDAIEDGTGQEDISSDVDESDKKQEADEAADTEESYIEEDKNDNNLSNFTANQDILITGDRDSSDSEEANDYESTGTSDTYKDSEDSEDFEDSKGSEGSGDSEESKDPEYFNGSDIQSEEEVVVVLSETSAASGSTSDTDDNTVSAAADQVKDTMKGREKTVTVEIDAVSLSESDGADAGKLAKSVFEQAVMHTGEPDEGDYLLWHRAAVQKMTVTEKKKKDVTSSYLITYTFKYTDDKEKDEEVQKIAQNVVDSLELDGKTDYQKVYEIYKYICDTVEYGGDTLTRHSAYGAFAEQLAVCQGYALMFYRLALMAGIDNRLIPGNITGVTRDHGWNIVRIGDLYYNVDATLDRQKDVYDNFLLGSDLFEDHERRAAYKTDEFLKMYPMGTGYVFTPEQEHEHLFSDWESMDDGTSERKCYVCGQVEVMEDDIPDDIEEDDEDYEEDEIDEDLEFDDDEIDEDFEFDDDEESEDDTDEAYEDGEIVPNDIDDTVYPTSDGEIVSEKDNNYSYNGMSDDAKDIDRSSASEDHTYEVTDHTDDESVLLYNSNNYQDNMSTVVDTADEKHPGLSIILMAVSACVLVMLKVYSIRDFSS